jgi:hypothetical protein
MNTLKIPDKVEPMDLLSFLSISQIEALESNGSIEWLEYQEVFWIHNITNILVMRNTNQEHQQ